MHICGLRANRGLAALLAVTIGAVAAWAQAGRGGVTGMITDSSGAAIPSAQVLLTRVATGVARQTVTTSAGLYSFVAVEPGAYSVTVRRAGFQTTTQSNVVIEVDQTAQVNLTLATGTVQQTVEVSAAPPLLQSTNATIGQLITAQEIQNVPLNTRDVYQLVQLSPGVVPVNGVLNDTEFNARPGAEVSGYSINGGPQGTIAYMEDGSPLTIAENNPGGTIPSLTPPLDSVQEYRIETNNLSAAYQSSGSGVISVVSKSGTNQLHGDLFGYLRPNALAAAVPLVSAPAGSTNTAPPAFHRYQWGGSIGGPIKRDKVFFFADYEGTQQRTVDTYTGTVPTMTERQGDFSDLVDPATGTMVPLYNPFVPDQANGNRQPFAGNNLSAYLNPVAQAMVKFYPQPNRPGVGKYHANNYFDQGTDPNDAQKFDVRLDDSVSPKQQLFGRFSFARLLFGNANHYHNLADPQQYQNHTNDRNFLLGDDYTLSPTTIVEFRYSFVRHFENQTSDPAALGFDMTSVGFPASLAAQQVLRDMPYIYINGPSLGSPAWTNFHFATQNHDFITALDMIRGRHTLKVGVEAEKQFMNVGQPVAPSGFYMFDGTATSSNTWAGDGSAFADLMLGQGGAPGDEWQPAFSKDQFLAESNPYYGLYAQDDYQVSSKLTLNLGLRWDVFGGRNERYNRLEYFDPNVSYSINGVALKGGEQFVHNHQSPATTNLGDFGPRFGFAYQPFSHAVVRGGFGMFYGPSSHMVSNSAIDSDSFAPNTLWNATTLNADGNSIMANPLSNPFPSGVVQATNGRLGAATNLGSSLTTVLRSQPEPAAYNWNFGAQYELPGQWVLSASYVGNHGLHEISQTADLNQLPLSVFAQYDPAHCPAGQTCPTLKDQVPNPYVNAITDPNSALYGAATVPRWETLEPFPQFTTGGINAGVGIYSNPIESSIYNSVQLTAQKRMTKHFSMLTSFTGGKLLGTGDGPFTFIGRVTSGHEDWRNIALDKSLSAQDVSRWMSVQASYDLPIGPGRLINVTGLANELAGGWTVNTVLALSTGTPISVSGATNDPWFNQRPDLTCDPGLDAPKSATEWLKPNCYAMPADQFLPGTAPRTLDHVRSDGTSNIDLAIAKNFPWSEHRDIQFRAESFNLTNSVQLGAPNAYWNPADLSTFGQITGAVSTPRQFQFALRIIY